MFNAEFEPKSDCFLLLLGLEGWDEWGIAKSLLVKLNGILYF